MSYTLTLLERVMAVTPSRNITEIASSTVAGRPATGPRIDRSGSQAVSPREGRVLPEPDTGYDPKAPRGTYVDITV